MSDNALRRIFDSGLTGGDLISVIMEIECRRRGLSIEPLTRSIFKAVDGDNHLMFHRSTGPSVTRASELLLWNKWATKTLLRRRDIPVADGAAFDWRQVEDAVAWAKSREWNVVLKPKGGSKGEGFVGDVKDEASFRRGWESIEALRRVRRGGFLVEERFHGEDARFYVVDGKIVAAIHRIKAYVLGDGEQTVSELIDELNAERRTNPNFRSRLVELDEDALSELRSQGLTVDAVPATGQVIRLRNNANLSAGGRLRDVTDLYHPGWAGIAETVAAAVLPLRQFALDCLTKDVTSAPEPGSFVVLELEGDPGVSGIHFPMAGVGRNVCGTIVDAYLEGSRELRFDDGLVGEDRIDYAQMKGEGLDAAQLAIARVHEMWGSGRVEPSGAARDEDVGQPGVDGSQTKTAEEVSTSPTEGDGQAVRVPSLRIIVSGTVVGVGLRRWARRRAQNLGLTGWVRNRGGRVEMMISGDEGGCQQFIAELLQNPGRASVDRVRIARTSTRPSNSFRRRRSIAR